MREDTAERLRGQLSFRANRFRARFDEEDDGAIEERSLAYQRVMRELIAAEEASAARTAERTRDRRQRRCSVSSATST